MIRYENGKKALAQEVFKPHDSNLFLLRGLPGAGKTTVSQLIAGSSMGTNILTICADDGMVDEIGNYNYLPHRVADCHAECQNEVKGAMLRDVPVIVVHNTFVKAWELAPYYNMASNYCYNVHSLIVENRHGSSDIHDVPGSTIDRMDEDFNVELLPIESDWWQKYIS